MTNSQILNFKKKIKFLEKKIRFLEKLVCIDELTKIYNRRGFLDFVYKILKELEIDTKLEKRKKIIKNHSLIIFDIDNFKTINDHFGHLVGDKILKIVSFEIKKNVRSSDILGRWGGEEIVLFLIDTDKNQALKIANKIRKKIENKKIKIHNQYINITISGGVSDFLKYKDFKKVFKKADTALYKAKKSGKNKIVIV